jgi:hypothetical protein
MTSRPHSVQGRPPPGARSLRLRFALVGSQLHLLRRAAVAMRSLPSQPLPDTSDRETQRGFTGWWIELRDARDRVLYRRVLHDPLGTSVEVRVGDRWQRTQVPPRGTFSVTVPLLADAATFALVGPPSDDLHGRSRELGSFDLARSGDRDG